MTTSATYSDVEYVFEPHSSSLPPLRSYLVALWERRRFMIELAKADLRGPSGGTLLGRVWGVIDPLFQAGVYFFLFVVIRGTNGKQFEFLPVMIGTMYLFTLSTAALGEGGGSIRRGKTLMLNSTFPRALLPVTATYKALVKFVPSACVFVVMFPLLGGKLGMGLFLLPLLFVLQVLMNIGIALLVAVFVVFVRDALNVVNYITRLLFFATPVIYPFSLLPGAIRPLIGWQPLFALFACYQTIFSGEVPSAALVAQVAFWAIAFLVVGARVFRRNEQGFAVHL